MIRGLEVLSGRGERDGIFSEYTKQIHKGLDLDGVGFRRVPKEVSWQLVNDMAVQIIDISDHLQIPLPDVGVITNDNSLPEGLPKTSQIREVLADAIYHPVEYPNSKIRLSDAYLEKEIAQRLGRGKREPHVPLGYILPHELFHAWEFANTLEQAIRDAAMIGTPQWEQTATEVQAREFGMMWLMDHSVA